MAHDDVFGIVGANLAGAFFVERVVAQGGFAVVYRAHHAGFRAPVALKCLRIPGGMTPEQTSAFLGKFREEGELMFRLSAAIPEIVRPLHIDAIARPDGLLIPFLALEWLDGEGLDQVVVRRKHERLPPYDLASLVELLGPVARALVRAHHFPGPAGIVSVVHRDLKPENLFVCSGLDGTQVKILDFGIAEVCGVAQRVAGGRGMAGMNPFTPGYGAPEQWAPDRFGTTGPWTDVWGLALTMVEALAQQPAIDGEMEAMRRAALDPRRRPTPRTLGVTLPTEAERAFERALAVDPRDRTQDVEQFWAEIEASLGIAPPAPKGSRPSGRSGQRRAAILEFDPDPAAASVSLDLAVDPDALRSTGPRPSFASLPRAAAQTPMEEPDPDAGSEIDLSAPVSSARPVPAPPSDPPPPLSVRAPPPSSGSRAPRAPEERPDFAPHAKAARHPMIERLIAITKPRFAVPAILLGAAIALTLFDLSVARASGQPIQVGPVRVYWIAGPLALAGALLLLWKLVGEEHDG